METLKKVLAYTGIAIYGTIAVLLMLSEPEQVSGLWTNLIGCLMALAAALYIEHEEKKDA